jgi:hypothetical protein
MSPTQRALGWHRIRSRATTGCSPADPRGAVPPELPPLAPRRPADLVLAVQVGGDRQAAGPGWERPSTRSGCAPAATLVRYLASGCSPSPTTSPTRDPGPWPLELQHDSTRRSATGSARSGGPRTGEDVRPGHIRLIRPPRHRKCQGGASPAEGGCAVVDGAGTRDHVMSGV